MNMLLTTETSESVSSSNNIMPYVVIGVGVVVAVVVGLIIYFKRRKK